jgi:hypothetical protein
MRDRLEQLGNAALLLLLAVLGILVVPLWAAALLLLSLLANCWPRPLSGSHSDA